MNNTSNKSFADIKAEDKASLLVEVLPYIRLWSGKTIVVKYGGNAIGDELSLSRFAEDIVLMHSVGIKPVVVHGGGPQIGLLMKRLGKEPKFQDGLRVTDAETLDIARMVLMGNVNRKIVSTINIHGPLAVGLSGEDAGLILAAATNKELGFVGQVENVNPNILNRLLASDLIPVVATIGSDTQGQAYNINADSVASAIASALGASKLVFLTNIEGLRKDIDDPKSLISTLSACELQQLIENGSIVGGMIPKVQACLKALDGGVGQVHILDGTIPHSLLLELLTEIGIGTMITHAN